MKKLLLLALIFVMTIAAVGCASTSTNASSSASAAGTYQKIKPEEVKKMMDNGDKITIVDVRTAGEYNSAHLEGAINIPVETISDKTPTALPDLNAVIIVYCLSGSRSAIAAKSLIALGYTAVYDMGAITSWPYDTVTGSSSTPSASADGILSSFLAFDLEGSPVDATIFLDYKVTMINIWATFCSPCLEEMPDLGKLNAQYADKGFQVVGIVADAADGQGSINQSMVDTAKEIVSKTGADYLHMVPSSDLNMLILSQVSAVPTTIFVDSKGKQVGETYLGAHTGDEWASIIDALLKEVK